MFTGLTLTTDPLREGSDLSGSTSRPSCPNAAGGNAGSEVKLDATLVLVCLNYTFVSFIEVLKVLTCM